MGVIRCVRAAIAGTDGAPFRGNRARGYRRVAGFQLTLFGGFDLTDGGGRSIVLSSKKGRALLAYLAVSPESLVSRSKLADLLWADRGDDQARSSLRQTLSQVRKALMDDDGRVIRSTADGLSLHRDAVAVDARAFDDLIASEDPAELERAVVLYTGPFMDGLDARSEPFEAWLRERRARDAERAGAALRSLLAHCRDIGDCSAALDFCIRLLELDPLREDVHRWAMRLHGENGRWNDAIRQYRECVGILDRELGLQPDDETRVLYEEILDRRDGSAGSVAAPPEATPVIERPIDGIPAVAVMPFDDLGGGDNEDFFADGITEDIITELSRFPGLMVVARGSTFIYKDRPFTPAEVARDLGVGYLVTGSIRRAGQRLRLTAQLIEAASGKNVWAERYDRELVHIFDLQDELTQAIAAVLPGRVETIEAQKVVRKLPDDMAAYELLLVGKALHHRYTQPDCVRALDFLDRAIALQPDYAAAHAWKACVLGQALGRAFMPEPKALFEGAAEAVATALRLDDNEVEAHRVRAEIAMEQGELDLAAAHNDRALALNPNDPRVVAQRGEVLTWTGRAAEGVEWLLLAARLDPFSASMSAHLLGRALMLAGRYEEAVDAYARCGYPRFGYHADAAGCLAMLGRHVEAAAEVRRALALNSDYSVSSFVDTLCYPSDADRNRHRDILSAAAFPG